jgi:hypothetical protein
MAGNGSTAVRLPADRPKLQARLHGRHGPRLLIQSAAADVQRANPLPTSAAPLTKIKKPRFSPRIEHALRES